MKFVSLLFAFLLCFGIGFGVGRARAQDGAVSLTVEGSGFAVSDLHNGTTAFQNRRYVWREIPAALEGWKFTEVSGGVAAKITVRALSDGLVYVAATEPPSETSGESASSGWQSVDRLTFSYSDTHSTTLHVYRRPCVAGTSLTIPQAGWAGTLVLAPQITDASAASATETPPPSSPTVGEATRPPGVVIDYLPAASKAFVGSPTIAVLPDGTYVAAHDIFGPGAPRPPDTRIFQSSDHGVTWKPVATVRGQFWSSLFVHAGALYLFGTNNNFGQIAIRRSTDDGRTWTKPDSPDFGLLTSQKGMSCAPTPITEWNGRLWHAFELNPPGAKGRQFQAFLLSAPVDSDLLKASNWTRTTPLPYDKRDTSGNWLEGNAVVMPDGGLCDLLRISKDGLEKAALLTLAPDRQTLTWTPDRDRIDFPGGGVKFTVRYDPVSRLYWTLTNKQQNPRALRNVLALTSSSDLRHWTVEATLLSHPDTKKHAFQYVDWLFDGDDILAVSRTSWEGDTFHNANYLTFHRIVNFRSPQRAIGP